VKGIVDPAAEPALEAPPAASPDEGFGVEEGLSPNMFNRQAPKGFRMQPGPASGWANQPTFKCKNKGCRWETTRENLVGLHEAKCDQERQAFEESQKAAKGASPEEIKAIVIETVKPLFAEFAAEITKTIKAALPPAAQPTQEKPRSKKKNGSAASHRGTAS
jgi:hypothetical protein